MKANTDKTKQKRNPVTALQKAEETIQRAVVPKPSRKDILMAAALSIHEEQKAAFEVARSKREAEQKKINEEAAAYNAEMGTHQENLSNGLIEIIANSIKTKDGASQVASNIHLTNYSGLRVECHLAIKNVGEEAFKRMEELHKRASARFQPKTQLTPLPTVEHPNDIYRKLYQQSQLAPAKAMLEDPEIAARLKKMGRVLLGMSDQDASIAIPNTTQHANGAAINV